MKTLMKVLLFFSITVTINVDVMITLKTIEECTCEIEILALSQNQTA